jgi:hypothetical protein
MDMGTAVAIVGSLFAVAFGLVGLFGRGKSPHVQCLEHSALKTQIIDFTEWLGKIEKKLDRVIEQRNTPR